MAARRRPARRAPSRRALRPKRARARPKNRPTGFVGRPSSPVRDSYPEKKSLPALPPLRPPSRAGLSATAPAPLSPVPTVPAPSSLPPAAAPPGLLTLDAGFDVDGFARQLGESAIRVTVPRENLLEVLTRISDFMGFGIYVYTFSVRPLPGESLKSFEVELRRVDYSASHQAWLPFQERGRSSTPFGPGSEGSASP